LDMLNIRMTLTVSYVGLGHGWQFGIVVKLFGVSTKLLYIEFG